MASTVINDLEKLFEKQDVGIIYLYCNYRRMLEQTVLNLLGSLTQQLAQQRPGISADLETLYQKHADKKSRADMEEILGLLRSEASRFSRVFIVVDALDECINSHDSRDILGSSLLDLSSSANVNVLITSRFIPGVTYAFENCNQLEIRAEVEDVKTYVQGNITRMPKFVLRNNELQDTIIEAIANAVDGMFLLAQLHLDSLTDKTSPKAMKLALKSLPKGSGALEMAYRGAVERIDSQKPGLRNLADQVLSWITYARRPLRTNELQQALAIEIDEEYLDEENFSDIEEMINVCAGLVTVDENSKVIRFIHYTTQEYFESIRKTRFPGCDDHVALSCITYLMHNDLEVDSSGRFSIDSTCDLVEYAAQHWGHHVRIASSTVVTPSTLRLLKMDKRLRSYSELSGNITSTHWQSSPSIALWAAAYFGLEDAAQLLLAEGADVNCKMNGETALYVASTEGFVGVVRKLLDAGSDVELTGGSRGTALSTAAYHGHNEIIRLLIPRSFPWWRHGTALKEAIDGGKPGTVTLLLENGADISSPYGTGDNLARAIFNGSESLVRIFIDRGVTIDPCRAMEVAAGQGHLDLVRSLIAKLGKGTEAKSWVQSGVGAAAGGDHIEIVTQLLQVRSDIDVNPAKIKACRSGSLRVLRFLLTEERGLFPHIMKLLEAAVRSRQEGSLKILFEYGLSYNVLRSDYRFEDAYKLVELALPDQNIVYLLLKHGYPFRDDHGLDNTVNDLTDAELNDFARRTVEGYQQNFERSYYYSHSFPHEEIDIWIDKDSILRS
ncbi:putative ankyrin repeat protein [Lachnellula suecica]|uniref:Putative ankyrin repeat protein n=1 Tax=Lachnellula suecica TaxID=602035 RepID=A0A8T9C930_9HELO|nr:putative ankyrin repeat protein [Lachnellula suecica]